MVQEFITGTAGYALYVLIGVGIFTTVEIFLPMQPMPVRDRARGLLFALAPAPLWALVHMASVYAPVEPMISFKSGFGSPIVAAVALALWVDFQFYWFHRVQHRFLWRWHAVHHSVRNLSSINGYHHWSEPLWAGLVVGVPLLFIDVQIAPTLGFLTVIFRWQSFFIHAPTKLHLGPARLLLVDNRYHRIHHSLEPRHHDRNFGAMTPLWDWLFGTLYMPRKDEWPAVGLDDTPEPRTFREWATVPFKNVPLRDEPLTGTVDNILTQAQPLPLHGKGSHMRNLLTNQDGATAAEYALILAIIGGAIALAAVTLGKTISNTLNTSATCIGKGSSATAGDCP